MTKKPAKVKKVGDLDLNLKKLPCKEAFDIKQAGRDIFIEGFGNKSTVDRGDEIIQGNGKDPVWELDNFKRNPIILFNHGMDTLGGTPVGKAVEVKETPEGLFLKVKLSNSQAPGIKMVRDLVEERILKAFSVGFNPKQSDTVQLEEGKSVRKISKAELFEVSIVGVPMNQDSLFELSEKSLTTKSLHQIKSELLTARKAEAALRVEALLAKSPARHDVIAAVAKASKIEMNELLDMLAGARELPKDVEAAFPAAIKQIDLKQTLEEALASLADGATDEAVLEDLRSKLSGETEDDGEEDEEESAASGETEEEGTDKTGDAADGEGEGGKDGEDDGAAQEDAGQADDEKRKADFQDCVNAKVPKLIEEGMEQDQAVAVAISKCQEEGKCSLTPESKAKVFGKIFRVIDAGKKEAVQITEDIVFTQSAEKQVGEEVQGDQAPTTPVKTEDNAENFGSPFLEAAKQTNVLLGALISEIQGLRKEVAGLSQQSSVASEEAPSKEQAGSADDPKKVAEDEAKKALDSLNLRLKNLGF